jgi:hypothetical protein
MIGSLVRASLLLFVISFVGLVSINGSLNPADIRTAKAASLDIVLLSDSTGSLVFHLNAQNCPDYLAPGDSCTAHVDVENNGTETAEISQPSGSVAGVLYTCTGNDASSPGGGGQNIGLSIENVTYNEAVHLLDPGDSESFDVTFTLDSTIGNACQGKSAVITVTLQDGLPVTATPQPATATPTATNTPFSGVEEFFSTPIPTTAAAAPTSTLVAEVSAVVATPRATATATLTSEVLPARFPVTGQGWQPQESTNPLSFLFLGLGATGLGLLLLAVGMATRKRGER